MTILNKTNKKNSSINLGLHLGALTGNIGWVKYALDHGQPINSVVNGLLPIHSACCGGHFHVVKYLIEKGSDVNARRTRRYSGSLLNQRNQEEGGQTPLHYASANGDVELVELLIQHGADVNMTDKYGSTPISIAIAKKNYAVAMLLQQYQTIQSESNFQNLDKRYTPSPLPMQSSRSTLTISPLNRTKPNIQEKIITQDTASNTTNTTISINISNPTRSRRRSLPDILFAPNKIKSVGDKGKALRNLFRFPITKGNSPTILTTGHVDISYSTHCLHTIISPVDIVSSS